MYMYTLWGRKSTRLVMLIKLESASDPDQDTLWGRKHCLRIYFVGSETLTRLVMLIKNRHTLLCYF